MPSWIYIDLTAFFIVAALTGFILPQILLIAFRKNLFDEVDPRKIHHGAVPRLGGIAFFPSILFSLLLIAGFTLGNTTTATGLVANLSSLCFIMGGIIILYLVGMADDLIGLRYSPKFVAQVIAAAFIILGGIRIDNLHGLLTIATLPPAVAVVFTVILTVFITNAINLIDGIDGLASGLSAIACGFYGYVCYTTGLHIYGVLAFATLGALIPFFYYNVFGNVNKHKKIFMGDTGALTIGLILSVLSIRICGLPAVEGELNPGVVAFAPLLIPGFDVVRVYLHRIKQHRSPFLPDKTHIHHKLLALGLTPRAAMPCIVCASILLTIANYLVSPHIDITLLFFLDLLLWIIVNTILSRAIRRRQRRTGIILYE